MITLNLLPQENHTQLRQQLYVRAIRTATYCIVGSFLVISVLLAANKLLIEEKMEGVQQNIQNLEQATVIEQGGSIEENIRKLNTKLIAIRDVQSLHTEVENLIADIVSKLPEGIHLTFLTVDAVNLSVLARGVSDTRTALIELREVIDQMPYFSKTRSPITDLTQRENIDFDFSATLSETFPSILNEATTNK